MTEVSSENNRPANALTAAQIAAFWQEFVYQERQLALMPQQAYVERANEMLAVHAPELAIELEKTDGKLLQRLGPTLHKKATNYRERDLDLGQLDIIAFSSLKREVLDLNSHFPPPTEYLRMGWRSLSLVGPTFARVLFAQPDAPDFLRGNLGRSIIFDVGISL